MLESFSVLLFLAVFIGFALYIFSSENPINGFSEVILDDFLTEVRLISDSCELDVFQSDEIAWQPFQDDKGNRQVVFNDIGLKNTQPLPSGSYYIIVKDGQSTLTIDPNCNSINGNLVQFLYQYNHDYDFSDASSFKLNVLELQGDFQVRLILIRNLLQRDFVESSTLYTHPIDSTGPLIIDLKGTPDQPEFNWSQVNFIGFAISGEGHLVISQPRLS